MGPQRGFYEDTADGRQLLTTAQVGLMDSPAHYQIDLLSQVLSASAQRPAQGRARARVCERETEYEKAICIFGPLWCECVACLQVRAELVEQYDFYSHLCLTDSLAGNCWSDGCLDDK